MKSQAWIVLSLLAVLVSGLAFSQTTPAQDPAQRKAERLERDIAESRARGEQLASDLAATRAQLDGVLRYLDQQSKAAKAMADTLQASESAGFVYGINPDSRNLLLKGWRDQLTSAQQAPSATAAKVEAPPKAADKH